MSLDRRSSPFQQINDVALFYRAEPMGNDDDCFFMCQVWIEIKDRILCDPSSALVASSKTTRTDYGTRPWRYRWRCLCPPLKRIPALTHPCLILLRQFLFYKIMDLATRPRGRTPSGSISCQGTPKAILRVTVSSQI